MYNELILRIKRGWQKMIDNPQLFYTIFVALVISGAFLFIGERFYRIAEDAQNQLTHVRTSLMHSVFSEFAKENWEEDFLNRHIEGLMYKNKTITHFYVFDAKMETVLAGAGQPAAEVALEDVVLIEAARARPGQSFTSEVRYKNERAFLSWEAVTGPQGASPLGFVVSQQTMSQADQQIADQIRNGFIILAVVIALVMLLFLRHAKLIDYHALYRKMKEVNQMKDDFISMASHELRTPLTVIRGYAEMIRDDSKELPELFVYAEKINIAALQLDNLVEDMLNVSRLEQGRMEFDMEKTDIGKIAFDVAESFEISAKNKGLEIKTKCPKEAFYSSVDVAKTRQVLINLIGNAVKYTPKGDISVSVKEKDKRIEIIVEDTGVGLTSEEQKLLFNKFVRIQNDDTRDIRGTGLGLWITKQIVENMEGEITLESMKGVGSRFTVSFPSLT